MVLLLALLFSGTAGAKVNNYVGAFANLGEWTMLPSQSKYGPSFGVAGGAGALYELQVGPAYKTTRFLFDIGVGVQGGMTAFSIGSSPEDVLSGQKDLQGDPFDYVYLLKNRHDQYKDLALNVPVMIGVQHKKFYMLAGVKVYSHLYTKTASLAQLTTYGKYADIPNLYNQPEYQFFENLPIASNAPTKLNLDLDLSLEIGGRLGQVLDAVGFDVPKRNIEYRLAGYVDYGLLDLHVSKDNKLLEKPSVYDINPSSSTYVYKGNSMVKGLTMYDIMSTSGFAKAVNNLVVGLKFTILFQLPETGTCVICRDAYRASTPRYHGRRGMQYEE